MPIEKLRPKYAFDQKKIEELKTIAPECFADGKINWEALKEALDTYLEDESPDSEHFGLFWPGKREARRLASTPSVGTLIPVIGQGLNEESTRNVFIEGENLEVLKLLQKSYAGRIKMIYIDPPYNTGNDFIYDDNYTETIEDYLKRTGQIDEEGRRLTTNSRADGRFHSKWLSMMYPRLKLARNLLKDDGSIFVSIDDNEVNNLKLLCNEVFGEENFIGTFLWKRRQNADSRNQTNVSVDHEYIIVFGKSSNVKFLGKKIDVSKYSNPDNDPRGPWASIDLTGLATKDQRPNLHYDIIDPQSGISYPPNPKRGWSKSKPVIENMISEGKILFPRTPTGRPREKKFLNEIQKETTGFSTWLDSDEVGFTTNGTRELSEILGGKYFDFPKPTSLIKKFVEQVTSQDDIILDFFAGSGTTAQAILELNNKDAEKRAFILVQIPEQLENDDPTIKAKFQTIADVTKERISKIAEEVRKSNNGKGIDYGFRWLKLRSSNYKMWQNVTEADLRKLELAFEKFESPLIDNWKEENLLMEILLMEGFPLDSTIKQQGSCKKNKVTQIRSDFCEHNLLVCLDKKIVNDTINVLQMADNDVFICLDNAVTDEQKVTLSDKGLIKTI